MLSVSDCLLWYALVMDFDRWVPVDCGLLHLWVSGAWFVDCSLVCVLCLDVLICCVYIGGCRLLLVFCCYWCVRGKRGCDF